MICPYCSTEIEPIELAGKTFCSNCGLSINVPGAIKPAEAQIHNNFQPQAADPQIVMDPVPLTPTNTVVPPQPDINTLIEQTAKTFSEDVGEELAPEIPNMPSESPSLSAIQSLTEETKENPAPIDAEPTQAVNLEPTVEELTVAETNEEKPAPKTTEVRNSDSSILLNILDDEKPAFEVHGEDKEASTTISVLDSIEPPKPIGQTNMAENVKEVDTLGASGILLDILSDEAVVKTKETENKALEAAEQLVDLIKPAAIEVKENTQILSPKGAVKLKINVLDGLPENPVENPEILPAEEEDLLPEKSLDQRGPVLESLDHDIFSQELEVVEEVEEPDEKTNEAQDEISHTELPIEDTKENMPSILDQEHSELPKKAETEDHFTDTAASEENQIPEEVEVAEPPIEKPAESPKKDELQAAEHSVRKSLKDEHIKNYFSEIITNKETTKKKKKKAKKKRSFLVLKIIAVVIIVFGFSGASIFLYLNYKKPEPAALGNVEQTSSNNEEVATKLPTEIPYGYTLMDKAKLDESQQLLTAIYKFGNDEKRKITYSEQKVGDPKTAFSDYIKTISGAYEVKTIDNREYAISENGSMAWTNDSYLFKILIEGDTYKDLVIKMAESVE